MDNNATHFDDADYMANDDHVEGGNIFLHSGPMFWSGRAASVWRIRFNGAVMERRRIHVSSRLSTFYPESSQNNCIRKGSKWSHGQHISAAICAIVITACVVLLGQVHCVLGYLHWTGGGCDDDDADDDDEDDDEDALDEERDN